jgi:DMSO/TMAO reductase YedYZ molybdopterin-dependent catalytic subunit
MLLPPGQRAVQGFPRFGVDLTHPPPRIPDGARIDVTGDLDRAVSLAPTDLADLPRCQVDASLHCVAGWSAIGLRWGGVAFHDLYRLTIEPALTPTARVGYLVFVGLDGYRSIVTLADALARDVLLADRLDGDRLTPEHGAPVRLVSPDQYGFVSTKHLCRIELHRSEPAAFYHPTKNIQRALRTVRPHPRARVWHEERHRYLPSWLTRSTYRWLVKPPAPRITGATPDARVHRTNHHDR